MQKTIISLIVLVLLVVGGWYLSTLSKNNNSSTVETVAIVNGEAIPRSDLELTKSQILKSQNVAIASLTAEQLAQLQTQALDTLIAQALLRQATKSSGVTISEEAVDAQLTTIKGQFESESAFIDALASGEITEDAFKIDLKNQLTIQAYLEKELNLSSLTATEAEIIEAYQGATQGAEDAPSLADSHDQIEGFVINQKQQALINEHVQNLRTTAQVEIKI